MKAFALRNPPVNIIQLLSEGTSFLFVADRFSQLIHLPHERSISPGPHSWSGRYWEVHFWYRRHTEYSGRFLNAQASCSVPRPRQKLLWCWPAWEFSRWHHLKRPLPQLGQVAKTGAICLLEKNPVSVEDLRRGLVCTYGCFYWNNSVHRSGILKRDGEDGLALVVPLPPAGVDPLILLTGTAT